MSELNVKLLTLEDFDLAVESALKAAYPGRQKHKNFAAEIAAARKAFHRRLKAITTRREERSSFVLG